MHYWVAFGCACLGLLIGSMVRVVFRQLKTLDVKALGSIISVMAGAGVVGMFELLSGKNAHLPDEVYAYPIGLFFGYMFTSLLEKQSHKPARNSGSQHPD